MRALLSEVLRGLAWGCRRPAGIVRCRRRKTMGRYEGTERCSASRAIEAGRPARPMSSSICSALGPTAGRRWEGEAFQASGEHGPGLRMPRRAETVLRERERPPSFAMVFQDPHAGRHSTHALDQAASSTGHEWRRPTFGGLGGGSEGGGGTPGTRVTADR